MKEVIVYDNTSIAYKYIEQVFKLMPEAISELFGDQEPYNPVMSASVITAICSGQNSNGYFAVALKDDKVVGFIGGYLDSYAFSDRRYARKVMLYIHPFARSQELMTQLHQHFEQWAKDKGVNEIRSFEKSEQELALGYQRIGVMVAKQLT